VIAVKCRQYDTWCIVHAVFMLHLMKDTNGLLGVACWRRGEGVRLATNRFPTSVPPSHTCTCTTKQYNSVPERLQTIDGQAPCSWSWSFGWCLAEGRRIGDQLRSAVGRTSSGRFVKQEQWERWRAKRKLVSAPNTGNASAGVLPTEKIFRLYMKNPAV